MTHWERQSSTWGSGSHPCTLLMWSGSSSLRSSEGQQSILPSVCEAAGRDDRKLSGTQLFPALCSMRENSKLGISFPVVGEAIPDAPRCLHTAHSNSIFKNVQHPQASQASPSPKQILHFLGENFPVHVPRYSITCHEGHTQAEPSGGGTCCATPSPCS